MTQQLVKSCSLNKVANLTEVVTAFEGRKDPSILRASLEEDQENGWRGFYTSTEDSSSRETKFRSLDPEGSSLSSSNAFGLIKGISTGLQSFARSLEGIYQLFQTFPSSNPGESYESGTHRNIFLNEGTILDPTKIHVYANYSPSSHRISCTRHRGSP